MRSGGSRESEEDAKLVRAGVIGHPLDMFQHVFTDIPQYPHQGFLEEDCS